MAGNLILKSIQTIHTGFSNVGSGPFVLWLKEIIIRVTGPSTKSEWDLKSDVIQGFNKDGSRNKGGQGNSSESVDHQNQRHIRE
jgi:hypothetical protein